MKEVSLKEKDFLFFPNISDVFTRTHETMEEGLNILQNED